MLNSKITRPASIKIKLLNSARSWKTAPTAIEIRYYPILLQEIPYEGIGSIVGTHSEGQDLSPSSSRGSRARLLTPQGCLQTCRIRKFPYLSFDNALVTPKSTIYSVRSSPKSRSIFATCTAEAAFPTTKLRKGR